MAYAARTGDRALAARLRAWGPPPYTEAMTDSPAHATIGLLDSWNSLRGLADMFSIVYAQLQDIDFRRSATRLDLQVYVLEGRPALITGTVLAETYPAAAG